MIEQQRPLLLVEDDPNDEALALRAMRKVRVANPVHVVRDGVEALDWLFRRGPHASRLPADAPSLILLDLKLPRLDGMEVLKAIREDATLRRVPVVMLTASDEETDLVRGYDLGANSFIRKPVDFDQFVETVGRIGLYWLLLNELPAQH
jgi:two-component system, response regulator